MRKLKAIQFLLSLAFIFVVVARHPNPFRPHHHRDWRVVGEHFQLFHAEQQANFLRAEGFEVLIEQR